MEVLFWLFLCGGIGYYANTKGRSAILWALLAFFFSPIIIGIILALMKDNRVGSDITQLQMEHQQLHDRVTSDERMNQMQFQNMQNQLAAGPAPDALSEVEYKVCPYCRETIRKDAVICRFCHQSLTDTNMLPQAAPAASPAPTTAPSAPSAPPTAPTAPTAPPTAPTAPLTPPAPPAAEEHPAFCPQCGARVKATDGFCKECGAPLQKRG